MEEGSPSTPREVIGPKETEVFKFLELFAGFAGFSGAVRLKCGPKAEVMDQQDAWTTSWDILVDEHFEAARNWVRQADHVHLAPPCRSFTRARRKDKYGSVKLLRTDAYPQGWGEPMAEEGNKVAERTAILLDDAAEANTTSSTENPLDSFLWEQPCLARHVKRMEIVPIDQCAYGAESVKPTGILTDSSWVKSVCKRCGDAIPHQHIPLVGKTMDYSVDPPVEVWRTSLAAQYPSGLTWAWAKALDEYLKGEEWESIMKMRETKRSHTSWERVHPTVSAPANRTQKEVREEENARAVGGLRNPYEAIQHRNRAWKAGAKMRRCLLKALGSGMTRGEDPSKIGQGFEGFGSKTVEEAAALLATEFSVTPEDPKPLRTSLLKSILEASGDPEEDVCAWLSEGFPLGIDKELKVNQVFPQTQEDTKAVEESKKFPLLTEEFDVDELENYKSFIEAGEAAEEELERITKQGYATKCCSWEEVTAETGTGASLTRLGCIQKVKPDGSLKTRLVVDCRRSGINGLMCIRQRVVLPRVSEVASSWAALRQQSPEGDMELAVVDFQDAFYQCRLAQEERKHVVVKGTGTQYYVLEVVAFGLACGPLLWSRLAAALLRLAQACCWDRARLQCYVDDPILVVIGLDRIQRSVELALPLLLWQALGCKLSWAKLQRGSSIQWIGFQLQLTQQGLIAMLAPDKLAKLEAAIVGILQHNGMVP